MNPQPPSAPPASASDKPFVPSQDRLTRLESWAAGACECLEAYERMCGPQINGAGLWLLLYSKLPPPAPAQPRTDGGERDYPDATIKNLAGLIAGNSDIANGGYIWRRSRIEDLLREHWHKADASRSGEDIQYWKSAYLDAAGKYNKLLELPRPEHCDEVITALRAEVERLKGEWDAAQQIAAIVLSSLRWTGDGYEWTGGQWDYRMTPDEAVALTDGKIKAATARIATLESQLANEAADWSTFDNMLNAVPGIVSDLDGYPVPAIDKLAWVVGQLAAAKERATKESARYSLLLTALGCDASWTPEAVQREARSLSKKPDFVMCSNCETRHHPGSDCRTCEAKNETRKVEAERDAALDELSAAKKRAESAEYDLQTAVTEDEEVLRGKLDAALAQVRELRGALENLRHYVAVEGRNDDGSPLIGLAYDGSIWGPCHDPSYQTWELLELIEKWLRGKIDAALAAPAPQPLAGQGEWIAGPPKEGESRWCFIPWASEPYRLGARQGDCVKWSDQEQTAASYITAHWSIEPPRYSAGESKATTGDRT